MTREEVIIRLAQNVVYLNGQLSANIAVILPNYAETKLFSTDLYNKLSEVPAWLDVEIARKTTKVCEWGGSKILFAHNPIHLKGYSLDCIYRSKRALTQAGNQDLEYFNFLSAITGQRVIDFAD